MRREAEARVAWARAEGEAAKGRLPLLFLLIIVTRTGVIAPETLRLPLFPLTRLTLLAAVVPGAIPASSPPSSSWRWPATHSPGVRSSGVSQPAESDPRASRVGSTCWPWWWRDNMAVQGRDIAPPAPECAAPLATPAEAAERLL